MSIHIDHSVYPDLDEPPDALETAGEKADYVHRICTAWDFGIYPEQPTFVLFAQWRDVFDGFPVLTSPGYHTFRDIFGWPAIAIPLELAGYTPRWVHLDRLEGRGPDPCEHMI